MFGCLVVRRRFKKPGFYSLRNHTNCITEQAACQLFKKSLMWWHESFYFFLPKKFDFLLIIITRLVNIAVENRECRFWKSINFFCFLDVVMQNVITASYLTLCKVCDIFAQFFLTVFFLCCCVSISFFAFFFVRTLKPLQNLKYFRNLFLLLCLITL